MTKHEVDVIGGLNMTDQISNEAYKQIMIAAQEENEVDDVLDKIRAKIEEPLKINEGMHTESAKAQAIALSWCIEIIDRYMKGE